MQLLAQEEYGLRCLLQVVAHGGSRPLNIPEIAESEGLSTEYTGKLMRALRQGGLVQSTRGPGGGYRLVRPATETTPWDVIQALGGPFFKEDFCETHPGQLRDCIHTRDCSVRVLWQRVEGAVRTVLESVSLADLTHGEASMAVWVDTPLDTTLKTGRRHE